MNIVATNSEVRKLLTDFGLIGRDLLSKAASKAAENIAPSPDRLANVDRPGPQDQFVTNGGRTTGTEETPVLEARIPGTDHVVSHHPDQPEPQITTNGETRGASQAVGEGQNVLDNAASSAQDEARAHAEDVQRWGFFFIDIILAAKRAYRTVDDDSVDPEVKKQSLMSKMKGLAVSSQRFLHTFFSLQEYHREDSGIVFLKNTRIVPTSTTAEPRRS